MNFASFTACFAHAPGGVFYTTQMEHEIVSNLTVQRLSPQSPLFEEAVGLATDTWNGTPANEGLYAFIEDARRRALSIDPVLGVLDGTRMIFACLAIESPGRAALVFAPWNAPVDRWTLPAVRRSFNLLTASLSEGGVLLAEALLPADEVSATPHLPEFGFSHLTQLIYLRRRVGAIESRAVPSEVRRLNWHNFSSEREGTFLRGLELTYQESLDCPELTTLRATADVLAGHQAVGPFDPSLWWVACEGTEPVGVLLLSRMERRPGLELVYMGVAGSARGKGVGDALLARAVAEARRLGVSHLALAVDKRNAPARRLYARWGFVELARREAWIATPVAAKS
jgi:GNAT superfamily N-acetyltransferase